MHSLLIWCVEFYQKCISALFPQTCRYFPTCSNYALWILKNQNIIIALWCILKRILKCNQFFAGGIDYPIVKKAIKPNHFQPCVIKFWFVPLASNSQKFYIIKSLPKEALYER